MSTAIEQVIHQAEDSVPASLRALKRHYGTTDDAIGAVLGKSRSWVQERMKGRTGISAADLVGLAFIFGAVPLDLFLEGPDAVIRWTLDNTPDVLVPRTSWSDVQVGTLVPTS